MWYYLQLFGKNEIVEHLTKYEYEYDSRLVTGQNVPGQNAPD